MSPAELLLAHYPLPSRDSARSLRTRLRDAFRDRRAGAYPAVQRERTCRGFPFVVSGQVRVARGSVRGREVELYRVHAGEICVVSTALPAGLDRHDRAWHHGGNHPADRRRT